VIALETIYSGPIVKFAFGLAWTLSGHSDIELRRRIYLAARSAYQKRTDILHGDVAKIEKWIRDADSMKALTVQVEAMLGAAIRLYLLNPGFKKKIEFAMLGADVGLERLPWEMP